MSYTPKFQAVVDQLPQIVRDGYEADLRKFFMDQMVALGPYERLNNLYRIRPKRPVPGESSRIKFFEMNKMQDHFYQHRTNRDMILKMRQGGVTTMGRLIALDYSLFTPGVQTAIMAHVKDNVKQFFKDTKLAFRWFQKDWGQFHPVNSDVDNVNELRIKELGSSLLVCTEAKGLTLDFLHVSEAAFVEDSRISESIEAVPLSGWVILETTPDTASGMFYDMWELQEKGEPCTFKGHFYPWWFHYPEVEDIPALKAAPDFRYSEKEEVMVAEHGLTREHILWRRLKLSECGGDEGEFNRKYPEDAMTCFLSGSRSIFSSEILASLWKSERAPAFVGDLVLAA